MIFPDIPFLLFAMNNLATKQKFYIIKKIHKRIARVSFKGTQ